VNTEKTKHMVVSGVQNIRQNHNFLTANKTFESVARFRYLKTSEANQSCT